MKIDSLYNEWLENATEDADLVAQLNELSGEQRNDAFYRDLEFGTGGLRGVIGAGINRMNIYTVRRATQGMAEYIKDLKLSEPSVAISYDSRIKSDLFAKSAAEVLIANGIKVYIYNELKPTPMLSFAVRATNSSAGIMITASHNPAKYNGYKAYGADGCQLTLEDSETVLQKIEALDIFKDVKTLPFDEGVKNGQIVMISNKICEDFFESVKAQSLHCNTLKDSNLRVVYTPLNGTGNKPVREILTRIGISDVHIVKEQELPDGNFPTCPFPNPEIREALAKGLELCNEVKPDLLLATDPDCDRVGIAAPDNNGGYALFSGNEVGAMLAEYLCAERTALGKMPNKPILIKTIVSTDMIFDIAKAYNAEVIETLTGFKFIGEQIGLLEKKGEEERYVFGFEESYGYLAGTHCRDKDAVVAAMLICEMAAFYKSKGISMVQARSNLYEKYGYYHQSQESFQFEGESGMIKMQEMMTALRKNPPKEIAGYKVTEFSDYITSTTLTADNAAKKINLPKSDVLAFKLDNGASVIIRPSGTEPKVKAYYSTKSDTALNAKSLSDSVSAAFKGILNL